ncbi:MAG: exonuclease SbcCD subunit D [Anaerolineaceae bacterium]|jgi:exonuclease SbcD|nr:exonuclease SbcCD subunit D [Anaerolineaceae bacterium]
MLKLLHFADAHIDMTNFGSHDPETGIPERVMDFLRSLDTIVQAAIDEKVDLVIFAGDAYKDRAPAPTFQREWGRRLMRLSKAGIPTILLTGNHDISPSQRKAHAMQEFDTLAPEHIRVVSSLRLLTPADLEGLPVQVLAIPWITRAGVMQSISAGETEEEDPLRLIENGVSDWINLALSETDPSIPTILTAHASVAGAKLGNEQEIKIGRDVILPLGLVCNPRFDYVALGHIHRHQDLNLGSHPPVVYPGSIERVDFGEVNEEKGFVIAQIEKGHTTYQWRKLPIRKFIDCSVTLVDELNVNDKIIAAMPSQEELKDAIVRLKITYPQGYEVLIDETRLHTYAKDAFEFKLHKISVSEARSRLPDGQVTSSLSPLELLDWFWKEKHEDEGERERLQNLAQDLINQVQSGEE